MIQKIFKLKNFKVRRGIAAIEFAMSLPIVAGIITVSFYFFRVSQARNELSAYSNGVAAFCTELESKKEIISQQELLVCYQNQMIDYDGCSNVSILGTENLGNNLIRVQSRCPVPLLGNEDIDPGPTQLGTINVTATSLIRIPLPVFELSI